MVDGRALTLSDADWSQVAIALADREGTVGGDGLLVLGQGMDGAAFSMAMLNSDGSAAETCLNGLRCVARAGFAAFGLDHATVALRTSTAVVARAPELASGVFTVRETAGPATLDIRTWPLAIGADRLIDTPIAALGPRAFTAVAMPNPHLVAFVDTVDDAELVALGAVCEAAPAWLPNRANVSFAAVCGPDTLYVRTCERGVGLTDSCGSAMAAATYAACLTGRIAWDREILVRNRGGMVRAAAGADAMVTLWGNATFEYRGTLEVDLATATAGPITVTACYPEEIAAWQAVHDALAQSNLSASSSLSARNRGLTSLRGE